MWQSCLYLTQFVVFLYFIPGIISQETCNNDFDVRLIDGTRINTNQGRVEVCLNGTWGRVCDDGWDINDASTVCTEQGYRGTGTPTRRSFYNYSGGSGTIHLTNARCRSNNARLRDCDIDRTGVNNSCDQSEYAGVFCVQGQHCTKDGEVRLQGGTNEREGRVEFCFSGFWWEVCDNGWDEVDAKVVCSQLGYGKSAVVMNTFGSRGAEVILRNVKCNSSHTELSQCVIPEEIYGDCRVGVSDCGCDRAGVKCANLSDSITVTSIIDESTSETLEVSTNVLPISVIGAVVGSVSLMINILIIIIVVVTIIVALTRNRNTTNDNFGMKENEAYGTAQQNNDVVTQQNEAYGTLEEDYITVV